MSLAVGSIPVQDTATRAAAHLAAADYLPIMATDVFITADGDWHVCYRRALSTQAVAAFKATS